MPDIALRPGDTIFSKFVDSMNVTYGYTLTANRSLEQVHVDVTIEAVLENSGKWSKTYTLVPPAQEAGDFELNFPLDLSQFSDVFATIEKETGVSGTQNLTLKANLHAQAQTDADPSDKTFTQSIQTNLKDNVMTWTGDLHKSEPGSIEVMVPILKHAALWGLEVTWWRIISITILAILAVGFAIYFWRLVLSKETRAESEARQIAEKYKDLIVEITGRSDFRPEDPNLQLGSLLDVIKVAQGLLKPIHHHFESGTHTYWVYDQETCYEFKVGCRDEET